MHYCLFFSPLSHRRECCVLARPSLSPRVIRRKSLGSLSLSLYLSAPHQPKAASPSAHNWRSVAFSLSPLSLYRRAISRKLRRPPHIIGGVLRSLSHPSLSIGVPSAARCGSLRNRNWFITVDCCSSLSRNAECCVLSLVPLILSLSRPFLSGLSRQLMHNC